MPRKPLGPAGPPDSGSLSQGFAVAVTRLPSSGFSSPDSCRGVSTELLGRDFHPLERCAFMAHPDLLTYAQQEVSGLRASRPLERPIA